MSFLSFVSDGVIDGLGDSASTFLQLDQVLGCSIGVFYWCSFGCSPWFPPKGKTNGLKRVWLGLLAAATTLIKVALIATPHLIAGYRSRQQIKPPEAPKNFEFAAFFTDDLREARAIVALLEGGLDPWLKRARQGDPIAAHHVAIYWIVGDAAVGIGVREDVDAVTRDLARFVPHIIAASESTMI